MRRVACVRRFGSISIQLIKVGLVKVAVGFDFIKKKVESGLGLVITTVSTEIIEAVETSKGHVSLIRTSYQTFWPLFQSPKTILLVLFYQKAQNNYHHRTHTGNFSCQVHPCPLVTAKLYFRQFRTFFKRLSRKVCSQMVRLLTSPSGCPLLQPRSKRK